MWDNIFKPIDTLQRGVSAAWTRNAVIRNNIANVETPGFKASDVEFETIMARAIDGSGFVGTKTHSRHIDIGSGDLGSIVPRITERRDLGMRMDGNNVDIEGENVRLAQNTLYSNTLIEKLNSEIRRLRMAITEGR